MTQLHARLLVAALFCATVAFVLSSYSVLSPQRAADPAAQQLAIVATITVLAAELAKFLRENGHKPEVKPSLPPEEKDLPPPKKIRRRKRPRKPK